MPQEVLNACASICRPCHSAVHRSHDNDTLGQSFHTVALLLADEKARHVMNGRHMGESTRFGRSRRLFSNQYIHTRTHHNYAQVARFVAWARKVRPSLRSHHEVHLRYRR